MTASADRFGEAVTAAILSIPPAVPPAGRGWCAAVASILEVAAAKPGNVHPGASFDDLSFFDFVAAGVAISLPLDAAARQPLGETVLAAVRASVAAAPSNANLGIILVIAPIAAIRTSAKQLVAAEVNDVLASADAADAEAIWEAIQHAKPGGLGKTDRYDLAGPPPTDIREAMALAANHDTIASLWAHGYEPLFAGPVADLATDLTAGTPLETAIIRAHLRQLARRPDSHIARRHGTDAAAEVSECAADLMARERDPGWRDAVAAFDASLRSPRRLNPGTTADLVAAALYILLRVGPLQAALPFPVPRHA